MFFCFSEVTKALVKTSALFARWKDVSGDLSVSQDVWLNQELRNSLRSIEWDLEDCEETINILYYFY